MKKLLNKIESYGFECEAGSLINCVDWASLKTICLGASNKKEVARFDRLGYLPEQSRIDVVAASDYDELEQRVAERDAENNTLLSQLRCAISDRVRWRVRAETAEHENEALKGE